MTIQSACPSSLTPHPLATAAIATREPVPRRLPRPQHFKSVHFESPALAEHVRAFPAMLYFVFGPSAIAVLVAHNIPQGQWVAQIPFFPGLQAGDPSLALPSFPRISPRLSHVGMPIHIRHPTPSDLSVAQPPPRTVALRTFALTVKPHSFITHHSQCCAEQPPHQLMHY